MLPDAVMIAEETRGPMNADVFPTTEKSAKNRNLRRVPAEEAEETKEEEGVCELPCAKGPSGAVDVHLWEGRDFADHRLAVRVPRADHQAIVRLVKPVGRECHGRGTRDNTQLRQNTGDKA